MIEVVVNVEPIKAKMNFAVMYGREVVALFLDESAARQFRIARSLETNLDIDHYRIIPV